MVEQNNTLKPFHGHLVTPDTGYSFIDLIVYEDFNAKGFQELQPTITSYSFTNLLNSSFQYIFPRVDDFAGPSETVIRIITKSIDEGVGTYDPTDSKPAQVLELSGALDEVSRIIVKNITELAGVLDQTTALSPKPSTEAPGATDIATRVVRKSFDEFCGNQDTEIFYNLQTTNNSTKIVVKVYQREDVSTKLQVISLVQDSFSTNIANISTALVGATATGGSNPFDPSVAIGGNTIIGPTAPTNAQTVYISIPNTGISTIPDWNDLMNYGINLDYSGGSFSVSSFSQLGTLGQAITLFGLNATITQGGLEYSSTHKGFFASGIFGSPKLNRQINLTLSSSIISAPIILNPTLLYPNQNLWLTAASICRVIGGICGVNVHWAVPDVPVRDFSLEPGMNGLGVLSSMAQRAGATLRWYGNNNYYIAYPNFTLGAFYVPNQNLIAQSGISSSNLLDLETGIGGSGSSTHATAPSQGMYTVPISVTDNIANTGVSNVPGQSGGEAPAPQRIANVTKLLTSNDPPLVFDLPPDYDQVYIQILIPAGKSTSGANGLGIQNFVTADPQQRYLFSDTGFANTYIFQSLVGNSYIPQVKVDHLLMPANESVRSNNFVLSIFCTRKGLSEAFNSARQAAFDTSLESANRNPKFVQTYRGTINCYFFGVMPLPGMYASATVDDFTVSGVIENVTFTPPGILSINVARYNRINFVQPIGDINAT